MLPLDNPRWNCFKTFFGNPEEVPIRIKKWMEAIGSDEEKSTWEELCEQFLHQYTIADSAYAVAPFVIQGMERIPAAKRLYYLVDIGLIESARLKKRSPDLPSDLAESYHASVRQGRTYAVECLTLDLPKIEFRYLISTISTLYGHDVLGDLIFSLDCLCGPCPKCGGFVYPEQIQESGYCYVPGKEQRE